jgi:hypothetical protein
MQIAGVVRCASIDAESHRDAGGQELGNRRQPGAEEHVGRRAVSHRYTARSHEANIVKVRVNTMGEPNILSQPAHPVE